MTIEVELQFATENKTLPHPSQFREWVSNVLYGRANKGEMVIRIVDIEEMTSMNETYRKKTGPTNVLAFPGTGDIDENSELPHIGDIVICAPVIEKEANEQNKPLLSHWAHMVIHGSLHLLGYDHQTDEQAHEMESIETEILIKLGFDAPYGG